MARPSLQASQQGVQRAKEALINQGLMQKDLIVQLGCSRHPVMRFFTGKPIEQETFIAICQKLGLNWQDIVDLPQVSDQDADRQKQSDTIDITTLVEKVLSKISAKVQEQCGTVRVLDMSYPIKLNDIFTNVNILKKITGRRRKKLSELLGECNLKDFEKFGLGIVNEERLPGLSAIEKHKKVIVLGQPGAGKTTFLKHLAIQAEQRHFQQSVVPFFVALKNFSEAPDELSLLDYINQQLSECGVTPKETYELLNQQSALILLDGLDEVREEYHDRVLKEIRDFSEKFYDNYFVITCRVAAWDYTFEKFIEVEISDFNDDQIHIFVENWFKNKVVRAEDFLKRLHDNSRIQQLAVNPLLLTLLCLVFEESGDLPANRSELYKEGLDVFLKKWDAKRGIHRAQIYKKLSPLRKEDLMSQLALTTFQEGRYFFTKKQAEQDIADYIRDLQNTDIDPESLQLDSEVILRSIEAQHGLLVERARGIYSFSHLTFHEYFAAREIVVRARPLEKALQKLVQNISCQRWREVFLLSTEMSQPNADMILKMMKQKADEILASKENLQDFLSYINEKATSLQIPIKQAALRAFYLDIDFEIDPERKISRSLDQSANLLVCASFFTRVLRDTSFEESITLAIEYDASIQDPSEKLTNVSSANEVMYMAVKYVLESKILDPALRKKLQKIYSEDAVEIEDDGFDEEKAKHLADEARDVAKKNHYLGHEGWEFGNEEKRLLAQYYDANKLLIECLNSDCYVSREVREEVERNLLLPVHNRGA